MKIDDFVRKVSNLVLASDLDSKDWVKNPRMRSSWHRFFLWGIVTAAVGTLTVVTPISEYLASLREGVFYYRVFMSGLLVLGLVLVGFLTVSYFDYTLKAGHSIDLNSITFFYLAGTSLFGTLYFMAFLAKPDLFVYDPNHIHWLRSIGERSTEAWQTRLLFLLYSGFRSVGSSFLYVESKSITISVVNYVQTLYTFSLVSLLIAGYVNQRTTKSS